MNPWEDIYNVFLTYGHRAGPFAYFEGLPNLKDDWEHYFAFCKYCNHKLEYSFLAGEMPSVPFEFNSNGKFLGDYDFNYNGGWKDDLGWEIRISWVETEAHLYCPRIASMI